VLDAVKPDLFFTVYGKPFRRDLVQAIKARGVRTACWYLDDPFYFGVPEHDLDAAAMYDVYGTNCSGSLASYRERGVANACFLPVGIDPDVHRPAPTPVTPAYDLLFAGDWHPIRQQVLERLCTRYQVGIMGPWKERKIGSTSPLNRCLIKRGFFTPEDMVAAFHRARIVLNLHTWYGRWTYGVNPRLFETSGCGAFQLCDHKDEIPDFYKPDDEIVLYRDVAELDEQVGHWLARNADRQRIATNALKRSLADHTYVQRMTEVVKRAGLA
jgi:spore maturation protein CgeB